MAHFAQLDANNVVVQVIVVSNKDTSDANGVEKEHIGAAFCERLFGGNWKQTSYNGNIRKNYAGIGYTYHVDKDVFAAPQPFPSWYLDSEAQWKPPVPMPADASMEKQYTWDEATISWVEVPNGN